MEATALHHAVTLAEPSATAMLRWIPALPLFGALLNLTLGLHFQRSAGRLAVAALGTLAAASSFVVSVLGFLQLRGMAPEARSLVDTIAPWLHVGALDVSIALHLDPLSSVMCLVVTGIGSLIHMYSYGYMDEEPALWRFFGLLNLFLFAMLTLVLGDNVLLMFVGWEGVGFCSWALIGFWHRDHANTTAANKAFLVNRIGDFAFLCGTALLFWSLVATGHGTLVFREMAAGIASLEGQTLAGMGVTTLVALLLFGGAAGKSAQLPLYVWLPDAMAGPTPVSALIHAATMVTAGVYMLARMHFVFTAAPAALEVVATVGALTALFAASIGLTQTDIKKVLAYSTVSQLGYMFVAMGVGAYSAGIFHLVTHAFFKACLFLGAGSVIHAMHHEQDMRRMGGLRSRMPVTFTTFLVSGLALAGLPPFSGFFSKDAILWQAWITNPAIWAVAATAAAMTAFYVLRQVAMTFLGEPAPAGESHGHGDGHGHGHGAADAHESPAVMTIPLVILAAGALGVGWLGIPEVLGGHNLFDQWLAPVFGTGHAESGGGHGAHSLYEEYSLIAASVVLAVAGMSVAWTVYVKHWMSPDTLAAFAGGVPYRLSFAKYHVDEAYNRTFVAGTVALARGLAWFDKHAVDGVVNLAAATVHAVSSFGGGFDRLVVDGLVSRTADTFDRAGAALRTVQTGSITAYLYVLLIGVTVVLLAGAW